MSNLLKKCRIASTYFPGGRKENYVVMSTKDVQLYTQKHMDSNLKRLFCELFNYKEVKIISPLQNRIGLTKIKNKYYKLIK